MKTRPTDKSLHAEFRLVEDVVEKGQTCYNKMVHHHPDAELGESSRKEDTPDEDENDTPPTPEDEAAKETDDEAPSEATQDSAPVEPESPQDSAPVEPESPQDSTPVESGPIDELKKADAGDNDDRQAEIDSADAVLK